MGGEMMKKTVLITVLLLLLAALFLGGCRNPGWEPDNLPYEPDTPAPDPHDGVFVSDHGTMTFSGDGESVLLNFDEDLAGWSGLPAGEQEGTYVFLTGFLPPHGSLPIRYDVAHEVEITVGETTVVIELGIAAEDGRTATSGLNVVTPERIPMLFSAEHFFSVTFLKEGN